MDDLDFYTENNKTLLTKIKGNINKYTNKKCSQNIRLNTVCLFVFKTKYC